MKLKDIMTLQVETLRPDSTLKEAADKMRSLNVGALPICENDRIVGIVTDRDLTVRGIAKGCDPATDKVSQIMTRDVICGFEEQSVKEAASIMEEKQIRRMPVLDRDQRVIGIVSLGDLAVKTRDDKLSGEVLERISEPAKPRREGTA